MKKKEKYEESKTCFARTRIGKNNKYEVGEECSALKPDSFRALEREGVCGTMNCPFYKPHSKRGKIRTVDSFVEPPESLKGILDIEYYVDQL